MANSGIMAPCRSPRRSAPRCARGYRRRSPSSPPGRSPRQRTRSCSPRTWRGRPRGCSREGRSPCWRGGKGRSPANCAAPAPGRLPFRSSLPSWYWPMPKSFSPSCDSKRTAIRHALRVSGRISLPSTSVALNVKSRTRRVRHRSSSIASPRAFTKLSRPPLLTRRVRAPLVSEASSTVDRHGGAALLRREQGPVPAPVDLRHAGGADPDAVFSPGLEEKQLPSCARRTPSPALWIAMLPPRSTVRRGCAGRQAGRGKVPVRATIIWSGERCQRTRRQMWK